MICLFEDTLTGNFSPVALTRHVSDLLVGTMTLRARVVAAMEMPEVRLHVRGYLRKWYRSKGVAVEKPDGPSLFLNGRLAVTAEFCQSLPSGQDWALRYNDVIIAAFLSEASVATLDWTQDALELSEVPGLIIHDIDTLPSDVMLYRYLWDLLDDNGAKIEADFRAMGSVSQVVPGTGVHILHPERVVVGSGSVIKPGVVIDAEEGPVVIGENVEIMPNSVIIGPCFIGDNSKIKVAAKIYEKTSIGPWCKVGGEVENSILLGYSNKQHDGFIGHSYLGSWVNLGADTNTSDLKNNYGGIRIMLNKRPVDTGRMFLGSLIGDHAKTGINTMLNTGTVIGVCANVFGGGFPPKAIPSFGWGGSDFIKLFRLDEALGLARTVMQRRNIEFTNADEELLRYLFNELAPVSATKE